MKKSVFLTGKLKKYFYLIRGYFYLILFASMAYAVVLVYNYCEREVDKKKFSGLPLVKVLAIDTLKVNGKGDLYILKLSDGKIRYTMPAKNLNLRKNLNINYLIVPGTDEISACKVVRY